MNEVKGLVKESLDIDDVEVILQVKFKNIEGLGWFCVFLLLSVLRLFLAEIRSDHFSFVRAFLELFSK